MLSLLVKLTKMQVDVHCYDPMPNLHHHLELVPLLLRAGEEGLRPSPFAPSLSPSFQLPSTPVRVSPVV